jgi:competence protein ComEA
MEGNWKDYFTFTKKERIGIYTLLVLIAAGIIIPRFFTATALSNELVVEAISLEKAPPDIKNKNDEVNDEPAKTKPSVPLFPFDPNTLDVVGWKKLGIPDRTIRTIINYRTKGGRFRNAGDLQKMYGLKAADFERLAPFVRIEPSPVFNNTPKPFVKYVKATPPVIDINQADTGAFISLPGIGSKLANRIIHFRDKLGGFYSVEQVSETFGLPDSTFQLIKPRLQCLPVLVQKININTADVNTLKQHPYIRWNIANAIVQYRQQHGNYQSPEQLQQIVLITPEIFQKIATYITVE